MPCHSRHIILDVSCHNVRVLANLFFPVNLRYSNVCGNRTFVLLVDVCHLCNIYLIVIQLAHEVYQMPKGRPVLKSHSPACIGPLILGKTTRFFPTDISPPTSSEPVACLHSGPSNQLEGKQRVRILLASFIQNCLDNTGYYTRDFGADSPEE